MNEAEAFLRTICEQPDEDAPRLVYADWLDEHEQPERAEFIRVQIALARAAPGSPEVRDWQVREQELLTRHGDVWRSELRKRVKFRACWFSRGFIDRARLHAGQFADRAEDLLQFIPLRRVWLYDAVRRFDRLSDLAHRLQIDVLSLTGLGPEDDVQPICRVLARAPERREPELNEGDWLILVWAVWSQFDRNAFSLVADLNYRLGVPLRFGVRAFDDYKEVSRWCDAPHSYGSPRWIRLRDGQFLAQRYGLPSVAELADWVDQTL